jgi:hypothetical protein
MEDVTIQIRAARSQAVSDTFATGKQRNVDDGMDNVAALYSALDIHTEEISMLLYVHLYQ